MSWTRLRRAPSHPRADRSAATLARSDESSGGFVLLDALVAVAMLAALLSVLPSSFVMAREIIGRSQAWIEAREVAEIVLTRELGGELQSGSRSGSVNGRGWRASVLPERGASSQPAADGRMLFRVRLQVQVHGGRILEIETLRVGGVS